jgi:hypothetical protein
VSADDAWLPPVWPPALLDLVGPCRGTAYGAGVRDARSVAADAVVGLVMAGESLEAAAHEHGLSVAVVRVLAAYAVAVSSADSPRASLECLGERLDAALTASATPGRPNVASGRASGALRAAEGVVEWLGTAHPGDIVVLRLHDTSAAEEAAQALADMAARDPDIGFVILPPDASLELIEDSVVVDRADLERLRTLAGES